MASWSEVPVFDRRKQPRCVVCDDGGCSHCPKAPTVMEVLSRTTIQTVDPDGKGAIPLCPDCGGMTRRRVGTGRFVCDFHGIVHPQWQPTEQDTETP